MKDLKVFNKVRLGKWIPRFGVQENVVREESGSEEYKMMGSGIIETLQLVWMWFWEQNCEELGGVHWTHSIQGRGWMSDKYLGP